VQLPIDADLKAFADGGFIALFDEATGAQSDGSAGRRGVNLTVLDPATGAVRRRSASTPRPAPQRANGWPSSWPGSTRARRCWS
jgi:hypothetical protein